MSKISGQLLISGQFQDNSEISGISGQLGALQSTKWHWRSATDLGHDRSKCSAVSSLLLLRSISA